MSNLNYLRGRSREYKIKQELEKEGYVLVVRTAGSHSPVDIIGIKEMWIDPKEGLCFTGKLVQSKVSYKYKETKKSITTIETVNGSLIVERWEFSGNKPHNKLKKTKRSN